jgi:hypothetical protein
MQHSAGGGRRNRRVTARNNYLFDLCVDSWRCARPLQRSETMLRLARVLPLVVLLEGTGCASRHDAGEALIATGAVVAVTASNVAAGNVLCVQTGCAAQTSRRAAGAAAGVAAGVALAAVGAALASEPDVDSVSPKPAPPAPNGNPWRLVRKTDGEEEPPAYYIEQ